MRVDIAEHTTLDERQYAAGVRFASVAGDGFDASLVDRIECACGLWEYLRRGEHFEYLVLAFEHRRRFTRVGDFEHMARAGFADQKVQIALAVERFDWSAQTVKPAGKIRGLCRTEIGQYATIGHRKF